MYLSGNLIQLGNSIQYSLLLGFLITMVLIPLIVCIARRRNLLYWPNNRSSHLSPTPALGGIAIYTGFIIPYLLFSQSELQEKIFFISAATIIFVLGLIDDLKKIKPVRKLIIISLLAFLIIYIDEFTIFNLHGLFSINELPPWSASVITMILIIFIVNAINLLDGIDGLAGGMGIVILGVFSWVFYKYGNTIYLQMSLTMIFTLFAFLIYNLWSRKYKIFMGDSGSLLLGLILSISLIKYFKMEGNVLNIYSSTPPVTILALFVLPVFDSIHVTIKRLLMRRSPFHPDRNHIHHTYLKLGFSHQMASLVLIAYTFFFFFLSQFLVLFIYDAFVIVIITVFAVLFWHIPERIIRKNPRKYALKRNRYKNGLNGKNGKNGKSGNA